MLRINLLPTYLGEQKKVRLAIILASLLFAGVLFGMLGYHFFKIIPDAVARENEATEHEAKQAQVQKIADEARTERDKILPLQNKVNFVESVQFHNTVRQKIFANTARYTIPEVEYNAMQVQGNVLSVSALAKNLSDLGRFYLYMFGNPDLTAVSIQGIPSWPPANRNPVNPFDNPQQQGGGTWFPVAMTGTLVRSVVTPQLPTTLLGGQGGQGGFGGFGGAGFPGGGGFSGGSGGPPPGYGGFSGPPAGGGSGGGSRRNEE